MFFENGNEGFNYLWVLVSDVVMLARIFEDVVELEAVVLELDQLPAFAIDQGTAALRACALDEYPVVVFCLIFSKQGREVGYTIFLVKLVICFFIFIFLKF